MTKAFLFPGQGSQTVGMGKQLAEAFTEAREVFQELDDTLNQKLSQLMFEGPSDELTLTTNAQPALMASSIAVWRVLKKQTGAKITDASYVAGHSLGEYSALCAAGTFSLADTAKLLRIRGDAMQQAVPAGEGSMAAIIGLDTEKVEAVVDEASNVEEICVLANYNAPGQIVISGHTGAINRACDLAKEAGAKRALPLNVSAPFHSPLMQPAAEKMREALASVTMQNAAVPVIANVTADAVNEAQMIRDLLVDQVTGSVKWSDSVLAMHDSGVTHTVELGTGKVLSGLVRRIAKDIETSNIEGPQDIESFAKAA
jgi:[acyl-carrier-protein] S-malonyltransferase